MSDHPICHVEIPAIDPATTSKFYAEVFDWQIQADPALNYHMFEPQRGPGGAFVQVGETTGAKIGEVLIYVSTDDIDATLAQAEALGAKTLTPKTEQKPRQAEREQVEEFDIAVKVTLNLIDEAA